MNRNCEKIRDEVLDFVTGALCESKREAFEQHLANCEWCRAHVSSLGKEETLLADFFGRYEGEMRRGEEAVISAIDGIEARGGIGILSAGRLFIGSRLAKHGFAAAVIVVATIYFAITLSWISEITACIRQSM